MGNACCKKKPASNDNAVAEPEGSNPFKPNNRKCTDMLCMLFFLLFWVGMVVIAGVGYKNGQPERLIYGVDWRGRTCGTKSEAIGAAPAYDMTEFKYLIYPRIADDILDLQAAGIGASGLLNPANLKKLYGVCVKKCPMLNESSSPLYVHAYYNYTSATEPVNIDSTSDGASSEDEKAGSPWQLPVDTTPVLYRCMQLSRIDIKEYARCVDSCSQQEIDDYWKTANTVPLTCGPDEILNPFRDCEDYDCNEMVLDMRPNCTSVQVKREERQVSAARQDPVNELLSRKWAMVLRWIGDVQKAAFPILLCGGIFALILGFLWLILLRFFAGLFVWLVIILVVMMQLAITLFCAYEGNLLTSEKMNKAMASMGVTTTVLDQFVSKGSTYINSFGYQVEQDHVKYWAIACYVMIAADVVLLFLLIFMCSRIRIAIGIIRESSKALQRMPLLTMFPIFPTVFAMGLVAYWLVAAAYIATSAKISLSDVANQATGMVGGPPVEVQVSNDSVVNYLLIYHLFGLLWTSQFIQATAYTTIAGAFCEYYWTLDKRQITGFPVMRSYWRTLRYHFGSLAFGSLIIAIVQMIRIGLEYLDQQMRSTKQGNSVVKLTMCCMKCCLWCFEKCLKFLNNNAYIIIAMKGVSFCPAMKDSFMLLFANAARVATVSIISKFLMIMGKLFIAAFCMFFMFLFIKYPPKNLPTFFMGDLEHVSSPIFPMLLTGLLGYTTAAFFLDVYGTGIDTILLCFCEDCNVNKSSGTYYMSDELLAFIDGPAKKNAFRVYQPTRDVSARDSVQSPQNIASTAPPIMQPSHSIQSKF